MIGCEDEEKEAVAAGGDEVEPEEDVFSSLAPESPEEVLMQVSTLNSSKNVNNSKVLALLIKIDLILISLLYINCVI